MSRAREIQRLRQEIEFLDTGSAAERVAPEDQRIGSRVDQERTQHRDEVQSLREETEEIRAILERERARARQHEAEVERLTGSLRAARQEAAGHRLLHRELEARLEACEEVRDSAVEHVRELLGIVQELARDRDEADDRVISLEHPARIIRPGS